MAKDNFLLRRKKSEILPNLPSKLEQKVYLDVESPKEGLLSNFKEFNDNPQQLNLQVEQLIENEKEPEGNLAEYCRELGLAKVSSVFDYLKQLLSQISKKDKILVFCRHISVQDRLQGFFLFDDSLKDPLGVIGLTPREVREKSIELFQDKNSEYQTLISTFCLAEGVTLHAANYLIFAEMSWSRLINEQAEDRIHRIGQTKPCYIKHLIARDTIDEVVYRSYKRKRSEHSRMFGS